MNAPRIPAFVFPLALALAAAAAGTGSAQEAPRVPRAGNPHGDMKLDCRLCHSGASWELTDTGGFDHGDTGFGLEGLHRFARCRDCHREPVFAHVGTQCADCHEDIHRGRLGPSCADCHTPAGWVDRPEMQRAHVETALPLVGAHARVDCDACHAGAVSGDYVGTPRECVACHRAEYEGTGDPDHAAAGFSTDCEQCHGVFSATWGSGDFIHSPAFPLTGAHRTIACAECHVDGFAGTPRDCYACHQADYDGTTNPDHGAANFPIDCRPCHTTTAFTPAVFDHGATGFLLTGAHRMLDCLACHANGYTGTPRDCYACHQADYAGTTDPDHQVAGFPVSCVDCHTTSAWSPSTWDHDPLFPIDSGPHRGAWNSCTECHNVPSSYQVFECILCHEHNQADMDAKHAEVPDYRYLSTACYQCHPNGRSGN